MENYTSPFTGKVYTVEVTTHTRMSGDWYKNEPLREVTVTQYNFLLEGNKVFSTFDLDEKQLKATVGEFEGVYSPWATSPRD